MRWNLPNPWCIGMQQKQAEKLKSREMKEDEWRIMKDEGWRLKDDDF